MAGACEFRVLGLLLGVFGLVLSGAAFGAQGVVRCEGPEGQIIFTDRSCSDFDARAWVPEPDARDEEEPEPADLPPPRPDCPRQVDILKDEVRLALEREDVNHLAALYHWTGTTHMAAHAVMTGLDSVARRGAVDIGVDSVERDGEVRPAELWLDQQDPARPHATRHVRFGLLENAGCWWIYRVSRESGTGP